ncbi:MAG: hypothetical protein IT368_18380, partial [Candidatus Hydrogenedentes bacterium]|nr:hypothetical protein [Candidatus Hydrogenedentota bacterium]
QITILQWRVIGAYASPAAFWYAFAAAVTFITALSMICTFLPMRLGLRHLLQREF